MGNCAVSGPNEAKIISGPRGTRIKVGQLAFVLWCIETSAPLSLELMTIQIKSEQAETAKGVPLDVTSVCQVRVDALNSEEAVKNGAPRLNQESILLAAQHFLASSEEEIHDALRRTLEGHQRQILGTLTVEEIYKDRAAFSAKVQEHVLDDLQRMGYTLVSYTVERIGDKSGYMEALGQTQTSLVKREANEGTARNESEARKKVATFTAEAETLTAAVMRESKVRVNQEKEKEAESENVLALKIAEYKRLQNIKDAEAEAAAKIERARQEQAVIREVTQQKFVQAEVELSVVDAVVERQQKELEGESKARLMAETNQAEALRVAAKAEADRIRYLGEAKADAIRAEGKAQADVLRERAAAFRDYGDAAVVELIVQKLPEIAHEIAAPLSKTEKMVFISNDGKAGSQMTGDMIQMLSQIPHAVKGLTGFDMTQAVARATNTELDSNHHNNKSLTVV